MNAVNILTQDTGTIDDCNFSYGVCDADAEVACGGYFQDFTSANNSDCQGWHREDACIYLKDDAAIVRVKATFDSFQNDGLDLNFGTANTGWDVIVNYLLIGKPAVSLSDGANRGIMRGVARGVG